MTSDPGGPEGIDAGTTVHRARARALAVDSSRRDPGSGRDVADPATGQPLRPPLSEDLLDAARLLLLTADSRTRLLVLLPSPQAAPVVRGLASTAVHTAYTDALVALWRSGRDTAVRELAAAAAILDATAWRAGPHERHAEHARQVLAALGNPVPEPPDPTSAGPAQAGPGVAAVPRPRDGASGDGLPAAGGVPAAPPVPPPR